MKKTIFIAVLFLLPTLAAGATVTLDGRVLDVERVELTSGGGAPAPKPAPSPEPAPPPVEDCEAGARASIDWASPGGRRTLSVPGSGMVYAFTTTDSPGYGGYVNIFEQSGQESVTRRVSISRCPGQPLPGPRCSRTGTGLISVPWIQRAYSGACSLKPRTRYYLEVENVSGCRGSCGAYLSIPTNGRP